LLIYLEEEINKNRAWHLTHARLRNSFWNKQKKCFLNRVIQISTGSYHNFDKRIEMVWGEFLGTILGHQTTTYKWKHNPITHKN
jgi:hypothetical protein